MVESTAVANDSPVGTAFLLDGLPWWICNFDGAGYDNPIQSVVNVTRRYQVPHSGLQGFVPHPVLNRSHIIQEAGIPPPELLPLGHSLQRHRIN